MNKLLKNLGFICMVLAVQPAKADDIDRHKMLCQMTYMGLRMADATRVGCKFPDRNLKTKAMNELKQCEQTITDFPALKKQMDQILMKDRTLFQIFEDSIKNPEICVAQQYNSSSIYQGYFDSPTWQYLGQSDDGFADIFYAPPTPTYPQDHNTAWFKVAISDEIPPIYSIQKWKANCRTGQLIKVRGASFKGAVIANQEINSQNKNLMLNYICRLK